MKILDSDKKYFYPVPYIFTIMLFILHNKVTVSKALYICIRYFFPYYLHNI